MTAFDVIVIGAGATGMMCAAEAGKRGKSVLLIDHYPKLGEKIRISGGGRCNFTNIHTRPEHFLSQNPHFCRSALARYTPQLIKLVEKHGIGYHEKTLGQLFCDDSATQIIAMLKVECDRGHVTWRQPCAVRSVTQAGSDFALDTDQGRVHQPRAGGGHRRPRGTEDRRDAIRLPACRPVRPEDDSAAARAGAAQLRPRDAVPLR